MMLYSSPNVEAMLGNIRIDRGDLDGSRLKNDTLFRSPYDGYLSNQQRMVDKGGITMEKAFGDYKPYKTDTLYNLTDLHSKMDEGIENAVNYNPSLPFLKDYEKN